MKEQINIPEALMGQALGIWQRLRNVSNTPLSAPGVPSTVPYEWPDSKTIKYILNEQSLTLQGIHLSNIGRIDWSDERETDHRLVAEFNVIEGVPFYKEYEHTESETISMEEATRKGLETALQVGLQGYGVNLSLNERISSEYEQKFGHTDEHQVKDKFSVGPITEPGTYQILAYRHSSIVSSRPIFDYSIKWERHTHSPDGTIEWWERVEWEKLSNYLDFISGMAADDIGVYHSGRIVSGAYGSTYENSPRQLAPLFRQQRQIPEIGSPVRPVQEQIQYGQGTKIVKVKE